MEELGGNDLFQDRFVAQHMAFAYYWFCVLLYLVAPPVAYNLNENIERHAYETYSTFVRDHADELRLLPAPAITAEYLQSRPSDAAGMGIGVSPVGKDVAGEVEVEAGDLTLLDVFELIALDEKTHAAQMDDLQREM
jgi:hypothetical protein